MPQNHRLFIARLCQSNLWLRVCVCVYQVREREKDREFILLPLLSFHQLYFHLCTVSSELDVDVGLSNTLPPSLFTGLPLV